MCNKRNQNCNFILKATLVIAVLACFLAIVPGKALAQTPTTDETDPLITSAQWTPANTVPTLGPLPPLGSGPNAPAEITGATGTPPVPPTSKSDKTNGSILGTQNGTTPMTWNLYKNDYSSITNSAGVLVKQYRGQRLAMSIRPRTLSASQYAAMQTLFGSLLQPTANPAVQTALVTDSILTEISHILQNNVMDPDYQGQYWNYDNTPGNPSFPQRKQEIADTNGALQRTGDASLYNWVPTLPTVKIFGRYLIILGVVVATIWVALGSAAMVHGYRNAGQQVAQGIGMFMLLLAAFTIYKIVVLNMLGQNSIGATIRHQANNLYNEPLVAPTLPVRTPAVPGSLPRSNMPVNPDIQYH